MHTNILPHLHIAHTLRRDQNKLPANTPPRRLNHHTHTLRAIHRIHKNVELVQTADGAAHGLPDRQQQTDSGERFLAARESLRFAAGVGLFGHVGLDFDVEFFVLVVDDDAAAEFALAEQVAEHEARAEGDVLAEHLPAVLAVVEGFLELL
jgi:hypothetical protein